MQEMYEKAQAENGYDKYIRLETGRIYHGGLILGKTYDPVFIDYRGKECGDLRIEGNGAIIDLQGQQIAINYSDSRLDIDNCIILNGNIRYQGSSVDFIPISPSGYVKHCTFYKPHDYAVRLVEAGHNIEIKRNIVIEPIDTGYDFLQFLGSPSPELPTGVSFAGTIKTEYGIADVAENISYFMSGDIPPIHHFTLL